MSSTLSPPAAGQADHLRVGLIIFGAALLANFHLFTIGWDHSLLGLHEFRQVQTALSTYYYVRDGVSLDYITPLFGPPWQVTLEFPLFQASVAGFVRLTGFGLDPAGRLVSWLFFMSALPAAYLLLGRFRLPAGYRLCFLALLVLSPIYLYYSRLFLIESTATAAGLWFLLGFSRVVEERRLGWLPVVWLAGSAAGTVKITTWTVFVVAAALLCFARWRQDPRLAARETRGMVLLAAAAMLPPFLAALGWTWHATKIRTLNPEIHFLNSHFGYWSFGDLALRLSWDFWHHTIRVWIDEIVGEAGLILLVLYFAWLRGRYFWAVTGCLAAFLSGQLIYSNLYRVHDYYFCASAVFLVAAVGLCLAETIEHPALSGWGRRAVIVALLALQLNLFERTFIGFQKKDPPVPQLAELLAAICRPDEMFVVLGRDWNGSLAYYSGRKAFMLLNGREANQPSMRQSIERLDPRKVAAVVMVGFSQSAPLILDATMPFLKLGPRPLFYDNGNTGVWVPLERQEELRASISPGYFNQFQMAPPMRMAADGTTLVAGQIRRQSEFDCFNPRPIRAHTTAGFAAAEVDFKRVLVTHSTTELVFALAPGATRVTAMYGLADNSYTDGNQTDGIELKISHHPPEGGERVLYSRHLNPRHNDGDRGPQRLDLAVPSSLTGELIVRVLPGPADSSAFDWAYLGQMTIR